MIKQRVGLFAGTAFERQDREKDGEKRETEKTCPKTKIERRLDCQIRPETMSPFPTKNM